MPPIRQVGAEQNFIPVRKPLGRGRQRKHNKKKNAPVCPLHGPLQDMKMCKVMLEQAKYMKST